VDYLIGFVEWIVFDCVVFQINGGWGFQFYEYSRTIKYLVCILYKMVLSGKKLTSSMSSITNQPTGGGSKKAGFPYSVGHNSWTTVYFNSRGLPLPQRNIVVNRFARFPSMNLPLGFNRPIKMH
jgi:hypothetical protein